MSNHPMPAEAPRPERDEVVEQIVRFAAELYDHATPTQALWFAMPNAKNATNRDRLFALGLQAVLARLTQAERALATERTAREEAERLAGERLEALQAIAVVPEDDACNLAFLQSELAARHLRSELPIRAAALAAADAQGGRGGS